MEIIKHTTDLSTTVYKDSLNLRKKVFVEEQQVPIELEVEGEDACIHFVLYEENTPQATVRLLPKPENVYKVQRMAVAKEARKKGYGKKIMTYIEEFAKEHDGKALVLGAQVQAIPFYETIGYQVFGNEYLDAGIKHFDMKKSLL